MLGFEYRRAEKEYEFELKIRSSQIRTSFNNPKPNYNKSMSNWIADEALNDNISNAELFIEKIRNKMASVNRSPFHTNLKASGLLMKTQQPSITRKSTGLGF